MARAEIGERANASSAMSNSSRKSARLAITKQHDIARIAIELMPSESQIPTASQDASRRFATGVALFYATLFGMTGTHLPFFTVWLKAVGIDAFWIGLITAVPPVTRFTALPLVTGLAERRQALRRAIIVTSFATAVGFCVLGTQHLPVLVFLIYALTCCLWTPMVPLTDAYALRGVKRYGLNYDPLRLWGSAAFILGALVCGMLLDFIAAQNLIWIIAGSAAIGAVASLALQPLDDAGTARPVTGGRQCVAARWRLHRNYRGICADPRKPRCLLHFCVDCLAASGI
ncbi:MFS transporter [Bradyrhizobium hereditatis]|uniref:MFS transporter n=1 Tax=Bradyrhizobium hereditatis TaxID=2821405 RepID=UPI002898A852|nr:MFS transporter [Bradyrhizobium hereditatis]